MFSQLARRENETQQWPNQTNLNDCLILSGILPKDFEYRLGNRLDKYSLESLETVGIVHALSSLASANS